MTLKKGNSRGKKRNLYLSYNSFSIDIRYNNIIITDDPVPPMEVAGAEGHSINNALLMFKGQADSISKCFCRSSLRSINSGITNA